MVLKTSEVQTRTRKVRLLNCLINHRCQEIKPRQRERYTDSPKLQDSIGSRRRVLALIRVVRTRLQELEREHQTLQQQRTNLTTSEQTWQARAQQCLGKSEIEALECMRRRRFRLVERAFLDKLSRRHTDKMKKIKQDLYVVEEKICQLDSLSHAEVAEQKIFGRLAKSKAHVAGFIVGELEWMEAEVAEAEEFKENIEDDSSFSVGDSILKLELQTIAATH